MTVYYYDLFTGASGGTAGTLLSSTTADSGATWPTSSSYNIGNAIDIDGNGNIFSSISGTAVQIPSAIQPSSYNFEVQYSFERLTTSTTGTQSGVLLSGAFPGLLDHWEFYYNEGSGFAFAHNLTPVGSYVAGPAVGTKWFIKVVGSTTGSSTTFTANYSITSGGAWTSLCTYTTTTPTDVVNVGPFFNAGSASTSTTGPHIGQLVVQDISATTASLSGPATGPTGAQQTVPFAVTLNNPAGYGGVVVTPVSSGTGDTFQSTVSGGNVTTITIPQGSTSGTFYLTASSTNGSRNISITSAPTLVISGTPIAFTVGSTATTITLSCMAPVSNSGVALTTAPLGYNIPYKLTLNGIPPSSGLTITPVSTNGSDVFSLTAGGAAITSLSIPYGAAEALTFYMTPRGATGSRTVSYTSSSLTAAGGPFTFNGLPAGQYVVDLYSGSGPLSAHTSDSGATCPSATGMSLDGGGFLYYNGTTGAFPYTAAMLPSNSSSFSFEVLLEFNYKSSVSGADAILILLWGASGHYEFVYEEGFGFGVAYNGAPYSTGSVSPPSAGTTWLLKLVVTVTSGSNIAINGYYSTNLSTPTWIQLFSPYTTTNAGYYPVCEVWGTGTAYTSTTGPHLGHLIYQSLDPTTATLAGPTSQIGPAQQTTPLTVTLNAPAGYNGVVITPASTGSGDAFQSSVGGGNVTTITIPAGATTGSFYFTPGSTYGSRNISITGTSFGTTLTISGSPISYTCTAYTATLSAPSPAAGIAGMQSGVFTVSLNSPAPSGGLVIMPAGTLSGDTFQATSGGSNVATVTIAQGATSGTFFLKPGGVGTDSISITTSPVWAYSGSPKSYTSNAVTVTLAGPSPASGTSTVQSAAFTVTLNEVAQTGGVVVTPSGTLSGDTFQATLGGSNVTSVTIPAGQTSVVFYLTPGASGTDSISITTAPAYAYSGSPVSYTSNPIVATLTGPIAGVGTMQSTAFSVTLGTAAPSGGITVTPASTASGDTFQATSGGNNVTTITIAAGQTTGSFYLTPTTTTGSHAISITTSPVCTYTGSPHGYRIGWGYINSGGTQLTSGSNTSISYTPTWTITSGDLLVVSVCSYGSAALTVKDSVNNVNYTLAESSTGGGYLETYYYVPPIGGSSFTITATVASGSNVSAITVAEYGVTPGAAIVVDSVGTNAATSTQASLLSALSVSGLDLVYAAVLVATPSITETAGTGFTLRYNAPLAGTAYGIASEDFVNGTSSVNPIMGMSGSATSQMTGVAFKELVATTITLSGQTQGLSTVPGALTVTLNAPAGLGGVAVTPSSSNSSDVFQAVSGGSAVTSITIPQGATTRTFYLLPNSLGNRSVSITTALPLTCINSPWAYNALAAATGYTVTGNIGGHQLSPVTWTVTLSGGDFVGTVVATPGQLTLPGTITVTNGSAIVTGSGTSFSSLLAPYGSIMFASQFGTMYLIESVQSQTQLTLMTTYTGTNSTTTGYYGLGNCQVFDPAQVVFTGNGILSKTFTFTPLNQDTVTFTFTNTGAISNASPLSYVATGLYLQDTFTGVAGTLLSAHTSNVLPGESTGSTWGNVSTFTLDGNGMVYMASINNIFGNTSAAMPVIATGECLEVQFDFVRLTAVTNAFGGVDLKNDSTYGTVALRWNESNQAWWLIQNGNLIAGGNSAANLMTVGTTYRIKVDVLNGYLPGGPSADYNTYNAYYAQYTGGVRGAWTLLFSTYVNASTDSANYYVGPMFEDIGGTESTGLHIGNLVVADMPPALPNCQIAKANISSSGYSAVFFFETISGNTPVNPTACTYLPSFYRIVNGVPTFIGLGQNPWVQGISCAILQFPPGIQIAATDVVTVSTSQSWMACGSGYAANGVQNFTLTNCVGMSSFGTDTLLKTLKPGFNISIPPGLMHASFQILRANLRHQIQPGGYGTFNADGSPLAMSSQTTNMYISNYAAEGSGIDNLTVPGIPGYYALSYDDIAYGTANQCNLSIASDYTGASTVSQVIANTGSNGGGQYYLYYAVPSSGAGPGLPLVLSFFMPGFNSSAGTSSPAYNHPNLANLSILGPGDFGTPIAGSVSVSSRSTALTFSASQNPSVLVGQYIVIPGDSSNGTYQVTTSSSSTSFTITPPYGGAGGASGVSGAFAIGSLPFSFSRANPYALNSQFLSTLPSGCGIIRFMDSFDGDGGGSNMCEPWEMPQLADFSWNANLHNRYTVTYSSARGLYTTNTYAGGCPGGYFYSDFCGTSWPAGSTLGAALAGPTAGTGTVSATNGSYTVTFSASQTGLTGYAITIAGDTSGLTYQITGGSGTTWTLEFLYGGPTTTGAAWTQVPTVFAVPSAASDPIFYGIMLIVDTGANLEYMRCRGVSGTTVTVERGSAFNTVKTPAISHASGAVIQLGNRYSWGTLASAFGPTSVQVFEVLSATPHNFRTGQLVGQAGNWPTMTFSDGTTGTATYFPLNYIYVTGPNAHTLMFRFSSTTAATLASGTTYSLTGCTSSFAEPPAGYPYEFQGMVTSQLPNCAIHACIPLRASDSFVYAAASKLVANTVPGRPVYIELADELWNYGNYASSCGVVSTFSQWNGHGANYGGELVGWWGTYRTMQIRAMFKTVFSAVGRTSDVRVLFNSQCSLTSMTSAALADAKVIAQTPGPCYGHLIDGITVAAYLGPENASANVVAWNNCTAITQMADLLIHDIYYNAGAGTNCIFLLAAHNSYIASYNTWLAANGGGTCVLTGYEGDYSSGALMAVVREALG